MAGPADFSPQDLRLMQGLAQQVTALRPELVNSDATVGELAWVWGKDHADLGDTWRRRLWFDGTALAGWGWIFLPYRVRRSDGQFLDVTAPTLTWQVHPDRAELLDQILDWYDAEVPRALAGELRVTVRDADADARRRLTAHGYRVDEQAAGDDGFWTQFNSRELDDLDEPVRPAGFAWLTAENVSPEAAAQAHRDAWHPSSFTDLGMVGVERTWPYRPDLHVLMQAPGGTLAATAIIWLDEYTGTAEFEPVGTHQGYRRQGLARVLLQHGMRQAKQAGARQMLVACLGAPAHQAARALYYDVGFRPFSREVPYVKTRTPLPAAGAYRAAPTGRRLQGGQRQAFGYLVGQPVKCSPRLPYSLGRDDDALVAAGVFPGRFDVSERDRACVCPEGSVGDLGG